MNALESEGLMGAFPGVSLFDPEYDDPADARRPPRRIHVALAGDDVADFCTEIKTQADRAYYRAWAASVRDELHRAWARAAFFRFWQPDMKAC